MFYNRDSFSVGGFSALADFMWWDAMSDVAHLLYPPFINITADVQNAFISEYKMPLDERAINLYILLNRLCAMAGCYLVPVDNNYAKAWIKKEVTTIKEILNKF